MRLHRLFVRHLQIEPSRTPKVGRRVRQRAGVGTVHREDRGYPSLVVHLDEERTPPLLDQLSFRRALLNFDPALRVDLDSCKAVFVEDALDLLDGFGCLELLRVGCR